MANEAGRTIRLMEPTCDRVGRYTAYKLNTWELRIVRILDLLEGNLFDHAKTEADLNSIDLPQWLASYVLVNLEKKRREKRSEIKKRSKKK